MTLTASSHHGTVEISASLALGAYRTSGPFLRPNGAAERGRLADRWRRPRRTTDPTGTSRARRRSRRSSPARARVSGTKPARGSMRFPLCCGTSLPGGPSSRRNPAPRMGRAIGSTRREPASPSPSTSPIPTAGGPRPAARLRTGLRCGVPAAGHPRGADRGRRRRTPAGAVAVRGVDRAPAVQPGSDPRVGLRDVDRSRGVVLRAGGPSPRRHRGGGGADDPGARRLSSNRGDAVTPRRVRHTGGAMEMEDRTEVPVSSETATFGAGCFWGVEWVYNRVPGVLQVVSGYSGGTVENPSYRQVCTGRTGHAEVI